MMAMYYGVPSVHAEIEKLPDSERHLDEWRRSVREAVEQSDFPRRTFFVGAAARLIGAHDDYLREVFAGDEQFNRICDRLGERLNATANERERAQHLRRLGRALCASISRECYTERPPMEAMSFAFVTLQWVIEAAGPALLEAPEALWMLLETRNLKHVAEGALVRIGPSAAPLFLDYFVEKLQGAELEGHFSESNVLASLGHGNVEVIRLLLLAMESWRVVTMWSAAYTLYQMGASARKHDQTIRTLLRLTKSPDGQRRAAAAYVLGGVARGMDEPVGPLLELTYDKHADEQGYGGHIVAGCAMTALGEIGRQPEQVVPRILEMFDTFEEFDSDMGYGGIHARQVEALKRFGRAAVSAVPVVTRCLEQRLIEGVDQWNDGDLLELLRGFGRDATPALPVLRQLDIARQNYHRQEEQDWDEVEEGNGGDTYENAADGEREESQIRKTIRAIEGFALE
jgi:hypothetical protein